MNPNRREITPEDEDDLNAEVGDVLGYGRNPRMWTVEQRTEIEIIALKGKMRNAFPPSRRYDDEPS